MNKKLAAFFVAVVILLGALFLYKEISKIKVTAGQLAYEYSVDKNSADAKYLNEYIYVQGKVKAFYKLIDMYEVLELQTGNENWNIFCFFTSSEVEYYARQLQQEQEVTVQGKCVGVDAYPFVRGIKIDVEEIKTN